MKETVLNMIGTMRQWLYPAEFRIRAVPSDARAPASAPELADALRRAIEALAAQRGGAEEDIGHLADWATRVWRVGETLAQADSTSATGRAQRHIGRLVEALEEYGIRIVDNKGGLYDPGMIVEVVSSEPTPGITRRTIVSTVRPAIYLRDGLIQPSQVVIGVPVEDGTADDENTPTH